MERWKKHLWKKHACHGNLRRRGERERGRRNILRKIIKENFQNLKTFFLHFQEAQQIPSRKNLRRSTPSTLKSNIETQDKKRILKAATKKAT